MTDRATYPAPSGSPAAGGARPSVLNTAFWLYLASIVVGLVASFVVLPGAQQRLAASGNQNLQNAAGAVIGGAIAVAIIGAVIWAVFVVLLRRDLGWARWVLLALTILNLVNLLTGYGLGAVSEVLAIVATVLALLPASSAYLREVAARRRTTKA